MIAAQPVRTDQLLLVPLLVEHAEEMAGVLADPALHTFVGGLPLTVQELYARYERLVAGSVDPAVSWLNWVIRMDGCLVGTVQATVTGAEAEIAWVVGTPWQRRGIATEAVRGLVAWLGEQEVRTVVAHIHPDHRASTAVAEAAGLEPTGRWHDGEVRWQRDRSPRSEGES